VTEVLTVRDKILTLEAEMKKLPQVELELKHYFAEGLYAREMIVPSGTLISGLVHRTETIGIMVKGKMAIIGEDGAKVVVSAPYTHVGKPGFRRVGYALEDVVWTTLHRTDLTDLEEIEKEQFVVSDDDGRMFDFATGKVRSASLCGVDTKEISAVGV
jgi:hypothetical protein